MSRDLLLMGCSRRKAAGIQAGPAWEVYDGPLYRVLRKRLGPRAAWPEGLDVLIVSARYGVIRADRRIETYDAVLTGREPPGRWTKALRRAVGGRDYGRVHVNLGRAYLRAVGDLGPLFAGADVAFAAGGIGRRAAGLVAWLSGR